MHIWNQLKLGLKSCEMDEGRPLKQTRSDRNKDGNEHPVDRTGCTRWIEHPVDTAGWGDNVWFLTVFLTPWK